MRKLFILLLFALLPSAALPQDIIGTWQGSAKIGFSELRLVFHITKDDSGYGGTMDSPDQGAKDMPFSKVIYDAPELTVEIAVIGFTYKGNVGGDGTIKGSFTQAGNTFPLDLTKGEHTANRPQTPRPPYPYHSEDVRFYNSDAGITLAGTLTLPLEDRLYTAAILVTGSGAQNRDQELFEHKPFLVIADHLTRNGIAVLRYDDRGFAESTGSFAGSTTLDFTCDALAAFDYLRTRGEINPEQIGIIGHSEGGTIAFMAAARQPQLGFAVSLAGCLIPGDSLLIVQNKDLMLNAGYDESLTQKYCAALRDIYNIKKTINRSYTEDNVEDLAAGVACYKELPEQMQKNLASILEITDPWFNYFVNNDISGDIINVRCPFFALNGEKDLQVNSCANLSYLQDLMKESGTHYLARSYPGLNHLFQECATGAISEYGKIEQTISPAVLDDITEWIKEVTN